MNETLRSFVKTQPMEYYLAQPEKSVQPVFTVVSRQLPEKTRNLVFIQKGIEIGDTQAWMLEKPTFTKKPEVLQKIVPIFARDFDDYAFLPYILTKAAVSGFVQPSADVAVEMWLEWDKMYALLKADTRMKGINTFVIAHWPINNHGEFPRMFTIYQPDDSSEEFEFGDCGANPWTSFGEDTVLFFSLPC